MPTPINAEPSSARLAGSGTAGGGASAPFVVLHPGSAQAKAWIAAKKPSLFGVNTPAAVDQGAPVSVSVKLIDVAASVNPPLLLRLRSKFPRLETLPGALFLKL